MTTGPTPAQVAAQVAMVRRHRPEERVIGIHTPGGWPGGATLQVNGESCTVVSCRSGLQIREALVSLEGEGTAPLLIIMTLLEEAQLGLDVLARLAGRQLYHIDPWQMVRDRLQAREVDPRLRREAWVDLAGMKEVTHHLPGIDTV